MPVGKDRAPSAFLQEKLLQPDPGQVGRVVAGLADDGEMGFGEDLAEPRELDWRGASVLDLEELTRREHEVKPVFLTFTALDYLTSETLATARYPKVEPSN